jgi:hypothetical protein
MPPVCKAVEFDNHKGSLIGFEFEFEFDINRNVSTSIRTDEKEVGFANTVFLPPALSLKFPYHLQQNLQKFSVTL